jgi:hypothetical protein
MSIPQKQLLELLAGCAKAQKQRYAGYHDDLLGAVGDVVSAEARHKMAPHNINVKVQEIIEALGDKIRRNTQPTSSPNGREPDRS